MARGHLSRACGLPVPLVSTTCTCREGVSSSWFAWLLCVHLRYAGRMSSQGGVSVEGGDGIRWPGSSQLPGSWLLPQPQVPWLKPPRRCTGLPGQGRRTDAEHPCLPAVRVHATNDLSARRPQSIKRPLLCLYCQRFFCKMKNSD